MIFLKNGRWSRAFTEPRVLSAVFKKPCQWNEYMSLKFSVLKVDEMKTTINYECHNNEIFLEIIFYLTTAPTICEHKKSIA
jgi:hypothetical protein